jgi:hypothetical protein
MYCQKMAIPEVDVCLVCYRHGVYLVRGVEVLHGLHHTGEGRGVQGLGWDGNPGNECQLYIGLYWRFVYRFGLTFSIELLMQEWAVLTLVVLKHVIKCGAERVFIALLKW